jgi:hypothetical protein
LPVRVAIAGEIAVTALGPSGERLTVTLQSSSDFLKTYDLLEFAPVSWWTNNPTLLLVVDNGWLYVDLPGDIAPLIPSASPEPPPVVGVAKQESIAAQAITGVDVALTDTLNFVPSSDESLSLYLNGVLQTQGSDYDVSGITITWRAGTGTAVDMSLTDELIATYTTDSP